MDISNYVVRLIEINRKLSTSDCSEIFELGSVIDKSICSKHLIQIKLIDKKEFKNIHINENLFIKYLEDSNNKYVYKNSNGMLEPVSISNLRKLIMMLLNSERK